MKKLNRRSFIKTATASGAAALTPLSANAGRLRPQRSTTKALVIGSGFGGSVATLRLCEAGIQTTLLERGKH